MSIFNKKRIRNIFLSIIILFSITFSFAYAQENVLRVNKNKDTDTTYNLLQKIGNLEFFSTVQTDENGKPILDSKGKTTPKECALTEYINIIFDLFIGICAVLAFVMLVIGGIQYMGSELVSSKEAAKSQATNAILGLLVAFSAWLILNTINPKLLDFCLDKNLQPAYLTVSDDISDEAQTYDGKTRTEYNPYKDFNKNNACPGTKGRETETCIPLLGTIIPVKDGQAGKYLEKDTLEKIKNVVSVMTPNGWRITEAYPPVYTHRSTCHQNGTCLDLNSQSANPTQIKQMIDALIHQGMCPNYEVVSLGPSKQQLLDAGVPNARIWAGKGSGPHIHVVNANCKN